MRSETIFPGGRAGAARAWAPSLQLLILTTLLFQGCERASRVDTRAKAPLPQPRNPVVRQDTLEFRVRPGDTYASLLQRQELDPAEARSLSGAMQANFRGKLYAGQAARLVVRRVDASAPKVLAFTLDDKTGTCRQALERTANGYGYRLAPVSLRVDTATVSGTLTSSLYDAFVNLGEWPQLIDEVTKVFSWDIDFYKDPRMGDRFTLLVEKKYDDRGRLRGYGHILAARYTNQGRDFYGIRDGEAYYSYDGRSLEKALLKAPLPFVRVSSGFTASRLHPVLGVRRPHWGIDYAAPTGTKVFAAGDGTVEFAHWVGGFGNCVKVRHGFGGFCTYYSHLSRFAPGVRAGSKVRQGEVIAFVGMTGLATGPHLDYRVEVHGKFINPATLKPVNKDGVPAARLASFQSRRDQLLALMAPPDPSVHLAKFRVVQPAAAPLTGS